MVFNEKPKILLVYKIERICLCLAFGPVIQERFKKCEIVNRLYCWSDEKLKKISGVSKTASWKGDRGISTVCIQKESWCVDVIAW